MLDQLKELDTSVIDELVAIKKERGILADRLERLEEEREGVSVPVYERVRQDYASQALGLEEKAAPLKEQARQKYAELQALLEETEQALDAARHKKEEHDLRHRLGEFDETQFKGHLVEIDSLLDGHEQDLAEISKVRKRFISAVDSESELEAPVERGASGGEPGETVLVIPEEPPGAAEEPSGVFDSNLPELPADADPAETVLVIPKKAPEAGRKAPAGADTGDTVLMSSQVPVPVAEEYDTQGPPPLNSPSSPRVKGGDDGSTDVMPGDASSGGAGSTIGPYPGPSAAAAAGGPPRTTYLPIARLVPDEPIDGKTEFAVEALTIIGRAPGCQIRIDERSVSREHARIELTADGFVLRDMGSENGIYVNSRQTRERVLEEGDSVQFGVARFVFHNTPPGSGPKLDGSVG